MRESEIEQKVCEHAERAGWLVRKVVYAGRRGAPDRFFLRGGSLLMVEFKRPGRGIDPHQQREHERLAKAGFTVHVVDSVEVGFALFT